MSLAPPLRSTTDLYLPITVIALRCVRQSECLEPLKNSLAAMCRVVRMVNPGGRIFIANTVPNPRSVLGQRTKEHNRLLCRAVVSINQSLQRVFICEIVEHFESEGQGLQLVSTYFDGQGDLTQAGCFIYRSALFREIGIVPYHV